MWVWTDGGESMRPSACGCSGWKYTQLPGLFNLSSAQRAAVKWASWGQPDITDEYTDNSQCGSSPHDNQWRTRASPHTLYPVQCSQLHPIYIGVNTWAGSPSPLRLEPHNCVSSLSFPLLFSFKHAVKVALCCFGGETFSIGAKDLRWLIFKQPK